MTLKLALPTRCFATPLKKTLRTVSELQVEGVQFDLRNEVKPDDLGSTGVRQLRKLLEELNLGVASGAFPLRKPLIAPEYLEERVKAIQSAMRFTFELGATVLTVRPGRIPDPKAAETEWKIMVDVLNDLASHGNLVGTTLCLTMSFEFPQRIIALLELIHSGPIGINFDPVGVHASRASLPELYREFHPWIQQIRARDGIRTIEEEVEETPIGMGEIDWPELIALLHESDFRGWTVLDRISGEDRPRDLAHGVKTLRQLMPF